MDQGSKERAREARVLRRGDEGYPGRLEEIAGAPREIYVLGRLPEESLPAVALIGARNCSEYGRYVATRLGAALARNSVQVISGMARGIDGIGQEAALEAGGASFAVLGCGTDVCYPAENKELYEKLIVKGGVISEYPPGTPPRACHFPPRNRIVSGLSDAVVVVEARQKSGTLITVDMALDQGKEVYVVPGRVTDPLSAGCNRLLKLGAGLFLGEEEFLEELWQICGRRRLPAGGGAVRGRRLGENAAVQYGGGTEENTAVQYGGGTGENAAARCGGRGEGAEAARGGAKGRKPGHRSAQGAGAAAVLTQAQEALLAERPDLAEVYGVLDFAPGSIEQIEARLPEHCRTKQLAGQLILLSMEGLAVQVSPGQFCIRS